MFINPAAFIVGLIALHGCTATRRVNRKIDLFAVLFRHLKLSAIHENISKGC
jgi:hypothetical protein